uniref:CCDC66 domain-containing protein n=1 Tax=Timema bartmani TaxID=61472 RepID=A0A7R9F6N0_9NEOP|nr:unnamed protein product [Timema bartmani]
MRENTWPPKRVVLRGYLSPESVESTPPRLWQYPGGDEANRMRWGDRGVGVGHLWEPTFHESGLPSATARHPQVGHVRLFETLARHPQVGHVGLFEAVARHLLLGHIGLFEAVARYLLVGHVELFEAVARHPQVGHVRLFETVARHPEVGHVRLFGTVARHPEVGHVRLFGTVARHPQVGHVRLFETVARHPQVGYVGMLETVARHPQVGYVRLFETVSRHLLVGHVRLFETVARHPQVGYVRLFETVARHLLVGHVRLFETVARYPQVEHVGHVRLFETAARHPQVGYVGMLETVTRHPQVGHVSLFETVARHPQVQGGGGQLTPGWLERGLNKLNHGSQPMLDRLNYGSQPMLERHIHGSQSMLDRLSHGSQPILERQSHGSQPMLERLNQDSPQVLVIRHPPQSASTDTALSSISNDYERSFIRGQNVPLDPEEMLERERKRQKALEHQNAIRMQVEERERQREEEREKRAQEERLEEERIRRVQEEERKRREQEQRQKKDKETREAQKSQAMKEALEAAERLAKSQKSRASRKHVLHKVGTSEAQRSSELSLDSLEPVSDQDVHRAVEEEGLQKTSVPTLTDRRHPAPSHTHGGTQTEHVAMPPDGLAVMLSSSDNQGVLPNSSGSVQLALLVSPSSMATGLQQPILLSPSAVSETRVMTPSKYRGYGRERSTQTETSHRGERTSLRRYRKKCEGYLPLVSKSKQRRFDLQHQYFEVSHTPRCIGAHSLAVIEEAIALRTGYTELHYTAFSRWNAIHVFKFKWLHESAPHRTALEWTNSRDSIAPHFCGAGSASLERPPHKGCKLPLRCRSQSQHKVRLEERPKWGVNRPDTQYIKQSEKDPFYQRRMRQRLHKPAQHPGSDNSSRSPSPQSRKNPDQRPVQRRKVQMLEPAKLRGSLNNNAGRLRQITLEGTFAEEERMATFPKSDSCFGSFLAILATKI